MIIHYATCGVCCTRIDTPTSEDVSVLCAKCSKRFVALSVVKSAIKGALVEHKDSDSPAWDAVWDVVDGLSGWGARDDDSEQVKLLIDFLAWARDSGEITFKPRPGGSHSNRGLVTRYFRQKGK